METPTRRDVRRSLLPGMSPRARRRVRRILRRLGAACAGALLAWGCPRLPPEFAPICEALTQLAEVIHAG
jgi:hypothetical protein